MIPTFYHSGEIGDLLYGLKAVSRLPLSDLYINSDLLLPFDPNTELLANPNRTFSQRDYNFVKDLLHRQPYLRNVVYGQPNHINYNLNSFRKEIFVRQDLNFSDLYVHVCGFPVNNGDAYMPWLYCDIKKQYPITAIRVERRNHVQFPWKQIVQKYHKDIVFLGTYKEYQNFTEYTGKSVEWNDYTNLLSICEIINGAKVHIGNSTSITVCAEALKKPIIYENEHVVGEIRYPTHEFHRTNRVNVDPDTKDIDGVMQKIEQFLSVK